jgi:hypothetical protein
MVSWLYPATWLQVGLTSREVVEQGLVATLRCLGKFKGIWWRNKDIKHGTDIETFKDINEGNE